MKLTLLHPTRERPTQFALLSKLWSHKDVEYLVAIDQQDAHSYVNAINEESPIPWRNCKTHVMQGPRLELPLTELPPSTEGWLTAANKLNFLASKSTGDWLMMVADDLYPQEGFLDKLLEFLSTQDHTQKLCFSFDNSRKLVQHGIISRALYNELGYYDCPLFWHVYSDNWGFELLSRRGYLKDTPSTIKGMVVHRHPALQTAKNDGVYSLGNHPLLYSHGKKVFEQLMKQHFPPKIGVSICVNNNEDTISQVLNSVRPFADLIHITNNDSTDSTMDIVASVCPTASISNYAGQLWDFSSLKNVGISFLEGRVDWIFCIDSDDIILNPETVRGYAEGFKEDLLMGYIHFKGGLTYPRCMMFRAGRGIRWEGAVHEVLVGYNSEAIVDIKMQPLELPKKSNQEPSIKRNIRIGEAIRNPGPRDLFYLANSYREDEQYSNAINMYHAYLKVSHFEDERAWAVIYTCRCFRLLKEYKQATGYALANLSVHGKFAELWMELAFSYYELQDWDKCVAFCDVASSLKIPDTRIFIEKHMYNNQPLITKGHALIQKGNQ